jgi:hypothetical protein
MENQFRSIFMKYYILLVAFLLLGNVATGEQIQLRIGDYNISFYTPDREEVGAYYDPFADYSSSDFGFNVRSVVTVHPTLNTVSITYPDSPRQSAEVTDNEIVIYSLSNAMPIKNESIKMSTFLYNKNIDNSTGFVGIKFLDGNDPNGDYQEVPKLVAWYPLDDSGTTTKEIVMIVSTSHCCEDTFKKLIETIHVEKVKT